MFTRQAPWADAKALSREIAANERTVTTQRLAATLGEQIYGLAIVARCLLPFIPRAAAELHDKLGIPITTHYHQPIDVSGRKARANSVLFPPRVTV